MVPSHLVSKETRWSLEVTTVEGWETRPRRGFSHRGSSTWISILKGSTGEQQACLDVFLGQVFVFAKDLCIARAMSQQV